MVTSVPRSAVARPTSSVVRLALVLALLLSSLFAFSMVATSVIAGLSTTTHVNGYNAAVQHPRWIGLSGSISHSRVGPARRSVNLRSVPSAFAQSSGVAAETADEALPGVAKGWAQRTADNGKGTVWQEPGATGNANSIRVMDPNAQYSNGYVRFYNEHGQPVGLDGKPGPNSVTHIPRGADGNYPLPKGWGQ